MNVVSEILKKHIFCEGTGCRIALIVSKYLGLSMERSRAIHSWRGEKELPVAVPIAKR